MGRFNWPKKSPQTGPDDEESLIRSGRQSYISSVASVGATTINSESGSPEQNHSLFGEHRAPKLELHIETSSSAHEDKVYDEFTDSSSPDTPLSDPTPSSSTSMLPSSETVKWASQAFDQVLKERKESSTSSLEKHEIKEEYVSSSPECDSQDSDDGDNASAALVGCRSHHDSNYTSGWGFIYIMECVITVYGSLSSLFMLVLAAVQPAWGKVISEQGMSLASASLLISSNAKLTEILTIAMFGLFVGQIISVRANSLYSKGISPAMFSVRLWITRPGVVFTHWESAYYAFRSIPWIATICILTTVAGTLYTTASNALVMPKASWSAVEYRSLYGSVQASYANPIYVENSCQNPITILQDPDYAASTCIAMELVGQAYADYLGYTQAWAKHSQQIYDWDLEADEDVFSLERPLPTAQLYSNTSVTGFWIHHVAMNTSRIVNNVTTAYPHPGVLTAVGDRVNDIGTRGSGAFTVQAAVPAPALNVLCANVSPKEIAPLVYTQWPNVTLAETNVPGWYTPYSEWWADEIPKYSDSEWLNSTSQELDDLFGWGSNYSRNAPVFETLPINYNTVANTSMYLGDSTYVLMKSNSTSNYTVCSLRSFLYYNCTTEYSVLSGATTGSLVAHCDDPGSDLEYRNVVSDAPVTISKDYPNIASQFVLATSLNDGTFAGNASTARQLTELILTNISMLPWMPALPSVAEALTVLAGSSVLLSAIDSPFVHYWQYNETILEQPVYETFSASVVESQYRSTYTQSWQAIFFFPLVWTCLASFYVTYYFLRSNRQITDYTEPETLLAVAVNSPHMEALAGSCGRGPEGEMLNKPIWVRTAQLEDNGVHYHFTENCPRPQDSGGEAGTEGFEMGKLGRRLTDIASMASFTGKVRESS